MNLIYPLIATGWGGPGVGGIDEVDMVVENCIIENCGSAAMEFFASTGSCSIINNRVSNVYQGLWMGWGLNTADVLVKNNKYQNISTVVFISPGPFGSYCFKNNKLDGIKLAPKLTVCFRLCNWSEC